MGCIGCIEGGGDGAGGRPVALDRDGERQEGEEPNSARAAAIYDHGRRPLGCRTHTFQDNCCVPQVRGFHILNPSFQLRR